MLNDRIAALRKEKQLSQEQLADVLNTSRQSISKWERGEAYPDLEKLKDLAMFFDVSIDYHFDYDVQDNSVKSFIERIMTNLANKTFNITIDEIKLIVSKNSNNFDLLIATINYLIHYMNNRKKDEIADLLIEYAQKAICVYRKDNSCGVCVNDIKTVVCFGYFIKKEYSLVKDYIIKNDVYDVDTYLASCEYELHNYEKAFNIASESYISSVSSLINSNIIQIRLLIKEERIEDAYDLANWSISFIKSISKKEEMLKEIVFIMYFVKAFCEKVLNMDFNDSVSFLRDNYKNLLNKSDDAYEIKFYYKEELNFVSLISDIKKTLYEEVEKFNDSKYYEDEIFIYNKVFGGIEDE